jgi:hypothetical protein
VRQISTAHILSFKNFFAHQGNHRKVSNTHVPISNPTQNYWLEFWAQFWVCGFRVWCRDLGFGPSFKLWHWLLQQSTPVCLLNFVEYNQVRKIIIILKAAANLGLLENDLCLSIICWNVQSEWSRTPQKIAEQLLLSFINYC